ncbi:MAG TPA: MoaD/ThiS family protein [Polyangiaceae bacterium]|jgi:molybdopterin converting factor small subunit
MKLRELFSRGTSPRIRVHVLVKGRIGEGWQDVDRTFALPPGSTLRALLDAADRDGVGLREAIASSPHLAHTLMLNGERCPVNDNLDRALADGDQVYLLAPLAGG